MSASDAESVGPAGTVAAQETVPEEHVIACYLREHPDFFDRFPGLLGELSLPHETGEAVSIFERQIAALREDKAALQRRFDELCEVAKQNENLNSRIHALALKLMGAAGPEAIFTTLAAELRDHFDAARTETLVFGRPTALDAAALPQFVAAEGAERQAFQTVFDSGRIRCGRLTPGQGEAAFRNPDLAGSGVLMPLHGRSWSGIIAIHSDDTERFHPDMATDLLSFLADVTALVLDPWVAHGQRG